MTALASVG